MEIALVTDGITPYVMGGMQRHSALLAKFLLKLGHEVHIFHTVRGNENIAIARELSASPEILREQSNHHFIEFPEEGKLPGHYVRDLKKYSHFILEKYLDLKVEADFIYAQGLTGWAFVRAKEAGRELPPVGINCHGYEMYQWAANLRTKLEHFMLRPSFGTLTKKADLVFSFDAKIKDILTNILKVPEERIAVVANGVEDSWLADSVPQPGAVKRFLFVGRHERRKGVPELNKVIEQCWGQLCEFHFVGPIPEELQLKDKRVKYHGKILDSTKLMNVFDSCDVLLCPSFAEGMPTVILEGMARGLAIIATDVGATKVMVDSSNGVLLDSCSVDLLREAILKILEMSDENFSKLQMSSLSKVKRFAWTEVSRDTVSFINRFR